MLITVARDNPLEFPVVFSDNEGAKLIDVDCFSFETVLQRPDQHPVFKRTGKALPFPDDCFVFPTLNQEIPALELLKNAGEKGSTVNFMADFSADGSDIFL